MNTKDIIKYVLIAAGAYLLYKWLSDAGYLSQFGIGTSTAAGAVTSGATTTPTTTSLVTTAPAAMAPTYTYPAGVVPVVATPAGKSAAGDSATRSALEQVASSTKSLVAALSQGDSYLNGGGVNGRGPFEHWNYYYNQTPAGKILLAPDPGVVGVDPNASITLDQWWALVSAHGVSGLNGLGLLNGLSRWQPAPSWVT